jgi:hypothetical protein
MRIWSCGLAVACIASAMGQSAHVITPTRLQAIVQVRRDSVGADVVKISMFDPKYSPKILRDQVEDLGTITGSGVRGLQITADPIDPKDPSSKAVKATFAIDGLIDPKGQWVKLAPIVKALTRGQGTSETAGLNNFQVDFDFEIPKSVDLIDFDAPEVDISRRLIEQSMEYTVLVKAQNSKGIDIPDFAPTASSSTAPVAKSKTDWFVVLAIGVAITAAGALVYCLFLLKPSHRNVRK